VQVSLLVLNRHQMSSEVENPPGAHQRQHTLRQLR